MNSFRYKLARFMQGRYGIDQFGRFLLFLALGLMILSSIFRSRLAFLYYLSLVLLIYVYFRMFSRNISKYYAQNQKYLAWSSKMKFRFRNVLPQNLIKNLQQMRYYHIYKCPNCRQKIRIPRGKGHIAVRCPKCRTEFFKNS